MYTLDESTTTNEGTEAIGSSVSVPSRIRMCACMRFNLGTLAFVFWFVCLFVRGFLSIRIGYEIISKGTQVQCEL